MSGLLGVVHYKFKNEKSWDQISFDSGVISAIDLKRAIVAKHKMAEAKSNYDLHLRNNQTGEVYTRDLFLIPKNSTIEVKRVPASRQQTLRLFDTRYVVVIYFNVEQMMPLGIANVFEHHVSESAEREREASRETSFASCPSNTRHTRQT